MADLDYEAKAAGDPRTEIEVKEAWWVLRDELEKLSERGISEGRDEIAMGLMMAYRAMDRYWDSYDMARTSKLEGS